MEFVQKYHTYLVGAATIVTVLAQALLGYQIPEWMYQLEAAIGLGSIRVTVSHTTGTPMGWKTFASAFGLAIVSALDAFGIKVQPDVMIAIGSLGGLSLAAGVRRAA